MKWYVLQVATGQELNVRDTLQKQRIPARVPREITPIRSGGKWNDTEKTLFPGYVFMGSEGLTAHEYYTATGMPGVIRILGTPPQPITHQEAEHIALLAPSDKPLEPSTVSDDGAVVAGPLIYLQHNIVKLDGHKRRAKVQLSVLGEDKPIELAITLEGAGDDDPSDETD